MSRRHGAEEQYKQKPASGTPIWFGTRSDCCQYAREHLAQYQKEGLFLNIHSVKYMLVNQSEVRHMNRIAFTCNHNKYSAHGILDTSLLSFQVRCLGVIGV